MGFLLLLFLEVIANKFIERFTNFLNPHCVAHLHFSFGIKFSLCLNTYQGIICLFLIGVFIVLHRLSSSCREWGYSVVAGHRLLIAAASLLSTGSGCTGFSSWGTWAQLPQGMYYLARPGVEPSPLVLAGRFLTTGSPEKTSLLLESLWIINIPLTISLFHSGFIFFP